MARPTFERVRCDRCAMWRRIARMRTCKTCKRRVCDSCSVLTADGKGPWCLSCWQTEPANPNRKR